MHVIPRLRGHLSLSTHILHSFERNGNLFLTGFQNICLSENIVADRARFAEIYQAIQQRKRIAVNIGSALPDLQEFVNKRLIDMEKKEQKALVQGNYNN